MENTIKDHVVKTAPRKEPGKNQKGGRRRGGRTHIKDIFALLWNKRFVVLFFFVLVVSITGVWTAKTPKTYRATTHLEIEKESLDLFPTKSVLAVDTTTKDYYNTQCKKLKSRTVAENVLKTLRLRVTDRSGEERYMSPGELMRKVSVTPLRDTRLVEVSVVHGDPAQARDIANTLADEFIKFNVTSKLDAITGAAQTIEKQLGTVLSEVRDAEGAFNRFKAEHNIPTDPNDILTYRSYNDLVEVASKAQADEFKAKTAYERLENFSVEELKQQPEVLDDQVYKQLDAQLKAAETELAKLSLRYGPKHNRILEQNKTVNDIKEKMDKQAQEVRGLLREKWNKARMEREKAEGEVKEAERRVHEFNSTVLAEYNSLKDNLETKRQAYKSLLSRGTESAVETGVTRAPTEWEKGTSNIRVIDRAPLPGKPFRPNPWLNMALGVFVGLVLGCGSAFLLEYLDDKVKNADDVTEELGHSLLAMIPKPRKRASPKDMGRIVYDHPAWHVAEAYRNLRTEIQLQARDGRFPSILVTSACPGEGKTTTAENLAIVIAQHGRKVLLIDTDMRRPRIRRDFDIDESTGLVKYLAGECSLDEALINKSEMARGKKLKEGTPEAQDGGLWILPCERRVSNSTEIIGSPKMGQLVADLKKRFDVIIFDSPPCRFSDPLLLANYADGIVAVVEAHKHSRREIAQGLEHLDNVVEGKVVFGVVLNKYNPRKAGGYGYYYGYRSYRYYRYYDRYYYDYYSRPRKGLLHKLTHKRTKKKTHQSEQKSKT